MPLAQRSETEFQALARLDGTYVFLEMNPFGQWAWVQDLCGLPLAEAHCRLFRLLMDGSFSYAC